MKVLAISAAFPPMAIAEADHTLHLCEHLALRGVEVELVTCRLEAAVPNVSFDVYPIMEDWSWRELPRLLRRVRRSRPETVLIIYNGRIYRYHPMITLLPTLLRRLHRGVRCVTQFEYPLGSKPQRHSVIARAMRKAMQPWLGLDGCDYEFGTLLRDSDQIIVLSSSHLGALTAHDKTIVDRTVIVPPPPLLRMAADDTATRMEGRRALGSSDTSVLITHFGRIYPSKRLDLLLRAFARVRARHEDVRLAMVGGALGVVDNHQDYVAELHRLAVQLGIEDVVTWTGEYAWDSDHGSRYLRASDICVLPFGEGVAMSNSSFAAAAMHGLPVVTTRGTVVDPQLTDGENVLLCPPHDAHGLADAIERIIETPELRERLRNGARELACRWFTWESATVETMRALGFVEGRALTPERAIESRPRAIAST